MQLIQSAGHHLATVLLLATLSSCPSDAQTSGIIELSAYGKIEKDI